MMDILTIIVWIIIIIIGTIVVQYLLNPYFHRMGLPKKEEKEKNEVDRKKEEEFYREIWNAKRKS